MIVPEPKSAPVISIIVPIYNVEPYLERCLSFIQNQTFSDFEVILVDDGSTDNSGSLCDLISSQDPRFIALHKTNGGLSDARNYGLAHSKGKYITFIDSDDWVSISYLEYLYESLCANNADIATCAFLRISHPTDNYPQLSEPRYKIYSSQEYLDIFFRKRGNRTIHYAWGKLYKRELLDAEQFQVGVYNEDVESTFKTLLRSKCIVELDNILYFYFINDSSITGAPFGDNYINLTTIWQHIEQTANQFGALGQQYLPDIKYNISRSYFTILIDSIIHGTPETDEVYKPYLKECLQQLRLHLPQLLKGPMRVDRKLMCLIVSRFYYQIRSAYRILKKK